MRICLVTSFPPSHGGLSEYGFHIAQELQRNSFVRLTILADELSFDAPELGGYSVVRCWSPDKPGSTVRLLARLRALNPDVVWFNLLFSTFGNNPLNAFAGLTTPLLTRLTGRYTHVTLHHLMDTMDLKDLGVRFPSAYRLAGAVATRILLLSNSVSVLMPHYRKILSERYGGENVHVRAHGILAHSPQYPDFSRRGNPEHRILAFGKWGTYKRLELMIEAFASISRGLPNAKLVIAGSNHPQAPGYVESIARKYSSHPGIEFTGYVQEEEVENLFQSASVLVMPYSSSTGCSGVAHLASAYGVPVVCADLEDFRQMANGEELAIEFYHPGDPNDLAECLTRLLQSPDDLRSMALQNFSAALRMTMPTVVQKYLRHFELQRHINTRRHLSVVSRLPNWLPSRSLFLRAITRNSNEWIDRSVIFLSSPRASALRNGHNDNGRNLRAPGTPVDGDGVVGSLGNASRGARRLRDSAAGNNGHGHSDGANDRQDPNEEGTSEISAASAGHDPDQSERKQPQGIPQTQPSVSELRPGIGRGGQRKR
jgi:glycosyltransferase involved in cell wall biosynthesis